MTMTASSDSPSPRVNEDAQEIPQEEIVLSESQRGSHDSSGSPTATIKNEKSQVPPGQDVEQQTTPVEGEKPYSAFTKNEKWFIVILSAVGGIFRYIVKLKSILLKFLINVSDSPLASSSYFPAIPTMAQEFHKSTELINLTVTVYMVLQGVGKYVLLLYLDCTFNLVVDTRAYGMGTYL